MSKSQFDAQSANAKENEESDRGAGEPLCLLFYFGSVESTGPWRLVVIDERNHFGRHI